MKPIPFKITAVPSYQDLVDTYAWLHGVNEGNRNKDGSYGVGYGDKDNPQHPLIRSVARIVIGYAKAFRATRDGIYYKRALDGLRYLLNEQQKDGQWVWHYKGERTGGGDSLYVTSIPTVALVEGWLMTYLRHYLDAAKEAADYLMKIPPSANANYNGFAAWSLASVYSVTNEVKYLGAAIRFAIRAIEDQRVNGAWVDEKNQRVWYHSIIVRGLAKLLSVMSENISHYDIIETSTQLAMNHLKSRLQFDGKARHCIGGREESYNSHACHAIATVAGDLNWDIDDCVALAGKALVNRNDISARYAAGKTMALGSLLEKNGGE